MVWESEHTVVEVKNIHEIVSGEETKRVVCEMLA